jgi:hypothetical protein
MKDKFDACENFFLIHIKFTSLRFDTFLAFFVFDYKLEIEYLKKALRHRR